MRRRGVSQEGRFAGASARGGWLAFALVGLIGLLMAHHPMLLTGLGRIQGSDDARLINYFLEHSYRWVRQEPLHRRFWDMPFFYPAPNTAGFSDTMLTIAPIYWGGRAAGLPPDTAFQLLILANSALNYVGGYWLLRSGFRRGVAGSIAGAFLFAFAASRVNEIEHQQLTPQIYVVATIMAMIRIFRDRPVAGDWRRAAVRWSAAGLGLVAQFYTSFYLGWFLVLAMTVAGAWALALPRYRGRLLGVVRAQWAAIGIAAVVSTAAIRPLADHYLEAMGEVGPRDYWTAVSVSIPDWRAWVYMGPGSWLWGWLPRLVLFHGMGVEQAMRSGVGLLTSLACLAGLLSRRRRPDVRLVALTMLGLLLATMRFHSHIAEGAALGFWLACVLDLDRGDGPPARRWALALLAAALGLEIFPGVILLLPMLVVGLVLATARPAPDGRLAAARWGVLAVAIAYPFLISHAHQRVTLGVGAAVAALLEIAARWAGPARRGGWLVAGGAAACAALWLFVGEVNPWPHVSRAIPGGQALRVVSRALLFGLIPASLGLACFVDLAARRRMRRGWLYALGVIIVLEQGVTTPSFDKMGQRVDVALLARKVDRRSRSFFYSPRNRGLSVNVHHLDAMWAQLETGVPTINGYSGATPPGWLALHYAALEEESDLDRIDRALAEWAAFHGMSPLEICWVREEDGLAPSGAHAGLDEPEDWLLDEWFADEW